MGVVRINAIGPGAVEYLLHGCDPIADEPAVDLDGPAGPGDGPQQGQGQEQEGARATGGGRWVVQQGAGYFQDAVDSGEPAGRWLGSGIEALGLPAQAGDKADAESLRAIFGELRYPESVRPGSTTETPAYLGTKPRKYATLSELVDKALKAEPDASLERQQEIELGVAQKKAPSATAYYDVTFSPAKSVSVLYAALLATGDTETALAIREAHDQAVRMAIEGVEKDVAWARTGTHGRASKSGQTVGEWELAQGLAAVLFPHHTNRDGEPQLHVHVAVLNRVALADGRIFALDGKAFRPIKDAMKVAYDRAFEALLADAAGVVFATRLDGKGREVAGISPELIDEASTRTRENVQPKIDELSAKYLDTHGVEPGPQALRRIKQAAVKATRQPKTGPAGPAAVAAWADREPGRRGRLEAALSEVRAATVAAAAAGQQAPMTREELLATGQPALATAGPLMAAPAMATGKQVGQTATDAAAARREELAGIAVPTALLTVQAAYATWGVGNLVEAIDNQLGENAGDLGLGITARQAWVRELAERALEPTSGQGVVQVSLGDPVAVPPELRRAVDGHSRFRPHINELYATADHVSAEERLRAIATSGGARHLNRNVVATIAGQAQAAGLSEDQVAALAGVLSSDRRIEVLVGPAGAGKSHTLARLATVWAEQHGGKVIGTATAQKATRNLAELGMEAINTHNLITQLTPDARGLVRIQLTNRDLIVLDEAGMASTEHFTALARAVEAAGAKMLWAGDHHQLTSPAAGGMFAHVASLPGTLELEQVHRFQNEWEREASLQLRVGDATVAPTYANQGRLRTGTLEQMEYQAGRDYLADRLAGVSSLLIVGSNEQAKRLSSDIQQDLAHLGVIGEEVVTLSDRSTLRVGDLVQARQNNAQLRVNGGVDEHGRKREALPVTNRDVYTVIGYDTKSKVLLARDERGAVAHLPKTYVQDHVALAYAVTNHSAQGLTVQRGRNLADRDSTRESFYAANTRGTEYNITYLVAEANPDAHDPQRIRDTAEARLAQILERGTMDRAAITVREEAIEELSSVHTLGDYYDRVAAERGHSRHAALVAEHLGSAVYAEAAFPALLGKLRAVELAGHDVSAVFEEAVAQRELRTAVSLSKVMHARVTRLVEGRDPVHSAEEVSERRAAAVRPAWEQLAAQHHERAAATGDAVETMLGRLADKAHARTEELGAVAAAQPPAWAIEWLGEVPDAGTDPEGHRQWTVDAGQVAAYREYRGVPEDQVSIGEAPPEVQQLAHELWTRAAAVGAGDPRAVDWRRLSDVELRETVQRWEREQQRAPMQVTAERGDALALAHDAGNDAITGRARLAAMSVDDPMRERLEARVQADEVMAEHAAGFAASLDDTHTARQAWWTETAPQREAANGARKELDRRTPASEQAEQERPDQDQQDQQGQQGGQAGRAPRGEQLDLDLETGPQGRDRFTDGLAVARERGLAELDPQLSRREREAQFARRAGDEMRAELRREHGGRLDPDGQLSDRALVQARMRELAVETPGQTSSNAPTPAQPAAGKFDIEHTAGEVPADPRGPEEPQQRAEQVTGVPVGTDRQAPAPDRSEAQLPTGVQQREVGGTDLGPTSGAPDQGTVEPPEAADPATVQRRDAAAVNNGTRAEQNNIEQGGAEQDGVEQGGAEPDAGSSTARAEAALDQVGDAVRELRRIGREVSLERAAWETAREREAQAPAAELQTPRAAMAAAEEESMVDDEIAQRRGPTTDQRSTQREQQMQRRRDAGMGMD